MTSRGSGGDMICKNVSEFRALVPQLDISELLRIEYLVNNKWCNLIQQKQTAKTLCYVCTLCNITQGCIQNVYAHVKGKRHAFGMQSIEKMYHPKFLKFIKFPTNSAKKNTLKTIPTKVAPKAATQIPLVTAPSKNNTKSNSKYQTERVLQTIKLNDVQNISSSAIKQNISSNESDPSAATTSNVASSDFVDLTSSQSDCDNSTQKIDEKQDIKTENIVINPFALKTNESTSNSDPIKCDQIKISCIATSKLLDRKVEEEKEDIATAVKDSSDEVIVIDDDKSAELDDKNEPLQESFDSELEEQPKAKKAKILLNPAAVVSENESKKEETSAADKPRYQSGLIIIPTIHKDKAKQSVSTSRANQPKFSTKTFSSKPNDNDILGLIGVEYVIKIVKSREDISPRYECGLCELVLDGFAMQNHLVGYNHRLKFCEKHFPTAIRQYRQYMGGIDEHEVFKVMTPILEKLAIAIEQHHGRDLPYECFDGDFNGNRNKILTKVFSCRHASEEYGPTFTHVIDATEVDNFVAMRHNYKPSTAGRETVFDSRPGSYHRPRNLDTSQHQRQRHPTNRNFTPVQGVAPPMPRLMDHQVIPPVALPVMAPFSFDYYQSYPSYPPQCTESIPVVDDETHKAMVENFLKDTIKGSHQHRSKRSGEWDSSDNNRVSRSHSNSHRSRELSKSISPLRENDIWQAYRHLVDQKLKELNNNFKLYRTDPEAHPLYNEEWENFWKRRKDELIEAGIDHRSYNYQIEWVRFFKVRLEELYSQAIENIKIESRNRLCLPMTNTELFDPKYHVSCIKLEEFAKSNSNREHVAEVKQCEALDKPNISKVVCVLRLMTAFEEYLGSLGPKIIELLSKALQVEKTNPTEINSILLTRDNCTLLETAMEKLKGLVLADMLESTKIRALNKVIVEVDALLKLSEIELKKYPANATAHLGNTNIVTEISYGTTKPVSAQSSISLKPQQQQQPRRQQQQQQPRQHQHQDQTRKLTAPSLLAEIDKKELAAKLASALAAQGKTDFNPEQLQQIVSVYAIIEKKKREAALSSGEASTSKSQDNRQTLSDTLTYLLNRTSSSSLPPSVSLNSTPTSTYANSSNSNLNVTRQPNVSLSSNNSNQMPSQQNIQQPRNINSYFNSTNPLYEDNATGGTQNNIWLGSNPYTMNTELSNNQRSSYGDMNRYDSVNTNASTSLNSNRYQSWGQQSNTGQNQNKPDGSFYNRNNYNN